MTEEHKVKKVRLDWENHYQETPMEELHWYSEEVDPEVLVAIKKFCTNDKTVLDLGTGPGTMAIELTRLGYKVTATDIAASAIDMAKERAGEIADKITFVIDDIRETRLMEKFDIIHDRGCFHVMDNDGITKYLKNVHSLLKDGGILLLKTFSTQEPRDDGPNRYDHESIGRLFSDHFVFLHSEETIYPSTLPVDPKAFFCVLKKHND
jgi:cyclopropane fatty-acyl-phospholipid synthase-like methyltransferase